MAGGTHFDEALNPSFNTSAGRWALGFLADLYQQGLTPRDLTATYFDEVSQLFRDGQCALIADWPAYYGLLTDPQTSAVAEKFGVALYPVGPAGSRAVYAGGHSFAIPTSVKDTDGALALVRFLTSPESQYAEAQTGAIVPRSAVMARVRGETPAGTVHAQRLSALGGNYPEPHADVSEVSPPIPRWRRSARKLCRRLYGGRSCCRGRWNTWKSRCESYCPETGASVVSWQRGSGGIRCTNNTECHSELNVIPSGARNLGPGTMQPPAPNPRSLSEP